MIKYIGKKHLNSNLYKKISLKETSNCIEIRALVDKRFKNIPTLKLDSLNILEQIEGINELEVLREIVMYYLRNNNIYELIQKQGKIIVISTSSRELELQLSSKFNCLVNDIINKYNNDRTKFIIDNKFDKIYVQLDPDCRSYKNVDSVSNYFIYGKNNLCLTLLNNNYNIAQFEKNFIYDYIISLINNSDEFIRYEYSTFGYDIYINDLCIKIPKILDKDRKIIDAIQNKRFEKFDTDCKQLKLEVRTWKI